MWTKYGRLLKTFAAMRPRPKNILVLSFAPSDSFMTFLDSAEQ